MVLAFLAMGLPFNNDGSVTVPSALDGAAAGPDAFVVPDVVHGNGTIDQLGIGSAVRISSRIRGSDISRRNC